MLPGVEISVGEASMDIDIQEAETALTDSELCSYAPMNQDTLNSGAFLSVCAGSSGVGGGSDRDEKSSACLTPVSFGMDLSMVANKGSMTLSVDGFDDDDEATLSAATTPSLPIDEPRLETCYCCPTHAEPPEVDANDPKYDFALPLSTPVPDTRVTHASPEHAAAQNTVTNKTNNVRRAHDPLSPRMQKQISMFEGGTFECSHSISGKDNKDMLHASINLPTAGPQQLRQDARLRKFENLTQSTSNSNFPFESNTLKRLPAQSKDYVDCSHTQSCINLKSNNCGCCGVAVGSTATTSMSTHSSPQHQANAAHAASSSAAATTATHYRLSNALSACSSLDVTPPHPGALIVKERFIEPPKRIVRGYNGKTQSMDADFLFNEFLLLPALVPQLPLCTDGSSSSGANTPSSRFVMAKISLDEPEETMSAHK